MLDMCHVKLKTRYFLALLAFALMSSVYLINVSCDVKITNTRSFPKLVQSDSIAELYEKLPAQGRKLLNDVLELANKQSQHTFQKTINFLNFEKLKRTYYMPGYQSLLKSQQSLISEDTLSEFVTKSQHSYDMNSTHEVPSDVSETPEDINNEEEEEEEIGSPRRDYDDAKKALKRNIASSKDADQVNNLFSQINMKEDQKKLYLFENLMTTNLLPHMSPVDVKMKMKDILPWWELLEVEKYPRVWYVGEKANKPLYNLSDPLNYGFDKRKDDEHEGRLKIVTGDHLEYRYEILNKLGSGSFGSVVRSRDHAVSRDHSNHLVAVKILHNDSSVEKYFKKELDMMKLVQKTTNLSEYFSTVLRTFFFRNHLCIVLELLGSTLDEADKGPVTNLTLLRHYTENILKGLVILHNNHIIHGDLKPDNLMLVRNCTSLCPRIKIADFNLACIQNSKDFACPGRYFQTRYYRAPEVILDLKYTETVDMWSLGVIVAELFHNKVPFYGETTTDQLAAIMEVMGLVPPHMVKNSPRIHTYQKAICYVCKNGFKRVPYRKPLGTVLSGMPDLLFDFVAKCFELDPEKRMTSQQALRHAFITKRKDIA